MTSEPADRDAVRAAGHLLDALAVRLQDTVPALRAISVGVADAWWDERGREWVERASLVQRSLERDLDAALAAGRAAAALLDALLVPEPDPAVTGTAGIGPAGGAGPGRTAADGRRGPGPRLPGTDAEQTDDEDGMRLGTFGG